MYRKLATHQTSRCKSSFSRSAHTRVLTVDNVSQNVIKVQYAVRGALVLRAYEIEKELKEKKNSLPFSRVTYCNIGNPQQLGQPPITFFRQVLSLLELPSLIDDPKVAGAFPNDVKERVKYILKEGGGTGAYSESSGREHVRKDVAAFINQRDGFKPNDYSYSSPDNIFLSDGASPAVQNCLRMLAHTPQDGIMIPIPQYPLYSATIPLVGGTPIPYYLDESKDWELNINELSRSVNKARKEGIKPKGLVVINPGNPTGSLLTKKNIQEIINFCYNEGILLMADEVYQENVYVPDKPFVSFKKALYESPKCTGQELLSFHSTSKGLIGECGKRGGYVEMTNIDNEVKQQYYKLVSVNLCPNIVGQVLLGLMVNPPKQGDESYPLFEKESKEIYHSLKRRAKIVVDILNKLEGISCNPSEGAMYAFPKITLPPKAIEEAKNKNMSADGMYCLDLLNQTGLCVVPGSGFGQKEGEFHFRTTILPREEHLTEVMERFSSFHSKFLNKYK